jgi:hypothetical protein
MALTRHFDWRCNQNLGVAKDAQLKSGILKRCPEIGDLGSLPSHSALGFDRPQAHGVQCHTPALNGANGFLMLDGMVDGTAGDNAKARQTTSHEARAET